MPALYVTMFPFTGLEISIYTLEHIIFKMGYGYINYFSRDGNHYILDEVKDE